MNKIHEAVLQRDNGRCFECAKTNGLQLHHLVPLSSGGEDIEDNCVMLCLECHIGVHRSVPKLNKYLCSGHGWYDKWRLIKNEINKRKRRYAFRL